MFHRCSCDQTSGSTRTPFNSAVPIVFGSAERMAAVNDLRTLKDLSMSEKWKLAEKRARVAGVGKRVTDYPWHKRMAVSDTATRYQTSPTDPTSLRLGLGLTTVTDQVGSDEEFFENLMKKMAAERFMPGGDDARSRKRTCLWNKENPSTSGTGKRHKEGRKSGRLVVPKIAPFTRRLLPPQTHANPPAVAKMQLQGNQIVPQEKLTLDQNQGEDITMKEPNSNMRCDSLSDTTRSINRSLRESLTTDNRIFLCGEKIFDLHRRNRYINNTDGSPDHECVSNKKYPSNFWTSPCLTTIEEYHESSLTDEAPTLDVIGTKYDPEVHLTPPLPTQSVHCEACRSSEEECKDNSNFSQIDDFRFPDINLFG